MHVSSCSADWSSGSSELLIFIFHMHVESLWVHPCYFVYWWLIIHFMCQVIPLNVSNVHCCILYAFSFKRLISSTYSLSLELCFLECCNYTPKQISKHTQNHAPNLKQVKKFIWLSCRSTNMQFHINNTILNQLLIQQSWKLFVDV